MHETPGTSIWFDQMLILHMLMMQTNTNTFLTISSKNNTGEQNEKKKMLFGIFPLIPLYYGPQMPKWIAILANQV